LYKARRMGGPSFDEGESDATRNIDRNEKILAKRDLYSTGPLWKKKRNDLEGSAKKRGIAP